jgi:TRAP-type mannitol/chloroaromatic compound transport system permease small subunit
MAPFDPGNLPLKRLSQLIDHGMDGIGRSVSWLTLVMVLLMALIVLLRYVLEFGSIAMQEAVMYLNALIFTLGAAYTLKENGHVRVDILYNRLGPRQQGLLNLLGTLLLLLPSMIFILYVCWDYVALSWRIREGSAEASGLPLIYLLKSTILLLAALLILQAISEAIKNWIAWRQGDQQQ